MQQNELTQIDKISFDEKTSIQVEDQETSLKVRGLEICDRVGTVSPLSQDVTPAQSPDSAPQSPTSSDTHEWYNSQGVRFTPQEEGISFIMSTSHINLSSIDLFCFIIISCL